MSSPTHPILQVLASIISYGLHKNCKCEITVIVETSFMQTTVYFGLNVMSSNHEIEHAWRDGWRLFSPFSIGSQHYEGCILSKATGRSRMLIDNRTMVYVMYVVYFTSYARYHNNGRSVRSWTVLDIEFLLEKLFIADNSKELLVTSTHKNHINTTN